MHVDEKLLHGLPQAWGKVVDWMAGIHTLKGTLGGKDGAVWLLALHNKIVGLGDVDDVLPIELLYWKIQLFDALLEGTLCWPEVVLQDIVRKFNRNREEEEEDIKKDR